MVDVVKEISNYVPNREQLFCSTIPINNKTFTTNSNYYTTQTLLISFANYFSNNILYSRCHNRVPTTQQNFYLATATAQVDTKLPTDK